MYIPFEDRRAFSDLIGITLAKVEIEPGMARLYFTAEDGRKFMLYHDQDCCEDVSINDIEGDLKDLIGHPITLAEESSNSEQQPGQVVDYPGESFTWTFYRIFTAKGGVVIRWFGSSNGYYSESVDFCEVK